MDTQHRLIQDRLAKIDRYEELGVEPFPRRFERSHRIAGIRDDEEALVSAEAAVSLAGRLLSKRRHGKMGFADLEDQRGRLQLWFRKDVVGEEAYEIFKLMEVGDVIGVHGTMCRTQKGETSCLVQRLELLTKSLRPLPEKWHGLKDKEARYRQRYVDLIMNRRT